MIWTAEHDETIRTLWPTHSASMIAREFGVTRNSVVGRVHRLKLGPKPPGHAANTPRAKRIKRVRFKENLPDRPAPVVAIEPLNIGIFDLEPSQCRFPCDGQGYKTLFCGHPAAKGLPYCPGHCSIAYP
jgi:GcrA cell cycle regulator